MTKLCDLLSIKRISGRPNSAPKRTLDTEYISRAARALAAMTLVRQTSASEIVVPFGLEREACTVHWIQSRQLHDLLWWIIERVADKVGNATQTLEDAECGQDILLRVMITKYGQAVHCRNDCPFLLRSREVQSLSWFSHCDPNDSSQKRDRRRHIGI